MSDGSPDRFERQIALPEIGAAGQARLKAATVVVVGLGGLGSPAALYLAAAGVGSLILVDGDRVEISNLQRQVLFDAADVGMRKVDCAARRLRAFWPEGQIRTEARFVSAETDGAPWSGADALVEATDRWEAKMMVARIAHRLRIPCVHGGVDRYAGQVLTVFPGRTACYGCLWGGVASTTAERPQGPLGAVPGVVGALQALEAVKVILGIGRPLTGRLLQMDGWTMAWRQVEVRPNTACPICGGTSG